MPVNCIKEKAPDKSSALLNRVSPHIEDNLIISSCKNKVQAPI